MQPIVKLKQTPLLNELTIIRRYHQPFAIYKEISLQDKNWFKTGGDAKFFVEPSTENEFKEALSFAADHNLALFILGHGANILVSDQGFDGLVIRPQLQEISIQDISDQQALLTAGAGVSMHALIDFCLSHNLVGLEEFSGIPGTVGGSVYINLHYFQYLVSHFLVSAQVIEKSTGNILVVDNDWFQFGYNRSKLLEHRYYLLTATFELQKATDIQTAYAYGRRAEIVRHREQRYPASNTCGSFFRNFYEDEVSITSNGKKMIYVAYYLDKIGVKGQLKVGGAQVSHQHANMIINTGNATSADILQLAKSMQQLVLDQFGIIPQPECQLIGFKDYPLL